MRRIYWGLFLTTLVTLGFQILLTRLFSVVTWYHFAFMAISLAMFGATAGAIFVYLKPRLFPQEQLHARLSMSSMLMAFSMFAAFLVVAWTPFSAEATAGAGPNQVSTVGIAMIALIFTCVAIPFFFSGIIVTLSLTRFPHHVNRLYAVDLAGAALGCVALIPILQVTDAATTAMVFCALACTSAVLYARGVGRLWMVASIASTTLVASFAVIHGIAARQQKAFIRVQYSKGVKEEPALYEKWNAFSRIRVETVGDQGFPLGWGMSPSYKGKPIEQLVLKIDGGAGTSLVKFDGNLSQLDFLKYDIINLAQHLRQNADVAAIGAGGGRDLLSGLAFRQNHVTGIEINQSIVKAVTKVFADFTGHLDEHTSLTLVNDEARSFITRSKQPYDIIQISLIDTWAASSAGAYVLTENSLYTVEAWETFLDQLKPGGIVTASRWYNKLGPTEVYRSVGLAAEALRKSGAENPRQHLLVARTAGDNPELSGVEVGTLLASNDPFSESDVDRFTALCDQMGFKVVLSPKFAEDKIFEALADADFAKAAKFTPLKITPPTDDNPFFFHFVYLRDIFRPSIWANEFFTFNLRAVVVLGVLLLIVTVLTALCILLPLWLGTRNGLGGTHLGMPLLYFSCIGMGFMMIEISQMQRLIVFLGHPIYGLAVVLFVILAAAGLGSLAVDKVSRRLGMTGSMALLLLALVVYAVLSPMVLEALRAASTPIRILTAAALLAPVAFCLGFAFPIGMRLAQVHTPSATAWLWGVNGATSVFSSVLTVALAIFVGINATFALGIAIYAVAVLLCFLLSKRGFRANGHIEITSLSAA